MANRMSANPTPAASRRPARYDEIAPGEHHWVTASRDLRHRLNSAIPHDTLKALHRKSPALHVAIALRQFALLAAASAAAWSFPQPWIWIPAALVSGWTIFNFTVLLHEAVHHAIFNGPHPRGDRLFGILYAVPSGISALQFTRWHLTHHAELGDAEADPKRHYLSPKINKPWFKLLYFTPALFPIYFRAARKENASYPPELQRRIAWERSATILFHLAVMAVLWAAAGPGVLARVYLVPVFLVFPIAFALNRLGQHYAIDPVRSGQVGLDPQAKPLLGLLVPLLRLSPRAPLLHRRAVLQPPPPALRAAPLLRLDRLEARDLRAALPSLDLPEQGAAHGLAPGGVTLA